MDTRSNQAFIDSQQKVFERHGLTAESRFLDIPAVRGRAHVMVSGEGPPVFMVIGGGGPGALWAPLVAKLAGYTLYAIDRPGFGLTDTIPHRTDNLRDLAVSFLTQVLDELELDRVPVISNSMGSTWVTWLAVDNPARVAAMIHIGTPAWILDTSAPLAMRLLSVPPLGRLMMRMQQPSPSQVEQLYVMIGEDLTDQPEIRDLHLECERLPAYTTTWLELLHAGLRLRGSRPEVRLSAALLRTITQPVQLIWGSDDPFASPSVGEEVVRLIPDAHLEVIPGGHLPWLSQPDRVAEVVLQALGTWAGVRDPKGHPRGA